MAEPLRTAPRRAERTSNDKAGPRTPWGQRLRHARAACDAAVALADDVRLLGEWLRHDVLAVAGPCHADRRALYDFVLAELQSTRALGARTGSVRSDRLLKNRRDDLLAFALVLDEGLGDDRRGAAGPAGAAPAPAAGAVPRGATSASREAAEAEEAAVRERAPRPVPRGVRRRSTRWPRGRSVPARWWRTSTAGCGT